MTPILELQDVHVRFDTLHAVDGVDLTVQRGKTLGIVGESGCGKSTMARVMVGLQSVSQGTVLIDGEQVSERRSRESRRRIQMVFQDPTSSLNPRMTVGSMLRELLITHGAGRRAAAQDRARELVELVGLPDDVLNVRPGALSGGQKQRVSIARALAVEPDIVVADEAVAALDVSVQATIVNLFLELQQRLGLTLVFISHDLGVVRALCDDVVVMYLGRIVESSPAEQLFASPAHPYTQALLRAAPSIELAAQPRRLEALKGELPSPFDVPPGCRFHPRCRDAIDGCQVHDPALRAVTDSRRVACVLPFTAHSTLSPVGIQGE
jgi:oligopeptide/dipeptide ABC transporter ATP-binding protein